MSYRTLAPIILAVPALSFAQQVNTGYLTNALTQFGGVVAQLVPLLIALALLVFIWGVVLFISKSGDEKVHEEGRRKMVWGIVALFVIVSVWGLVGLLRQVTGLNTNETAQSPQATFGGGGATGGGGGAGGGGAGGGGGTLCGGPNQPPCALCDNNCNNNDGLPSCDPWSCLPPPPIPN